MQSRQPSLFARDDTFFGVCHALGEDFGFNPLYLRVALGVSLLWNPVAVVAAYAIAGVLVIISRLLAPNPRLAAAAQQVGVAESAGVQPPSAHTSAGADYGVYADEFAIAA